MTFDEWESEVTDAIRKDTLWKMEVYRLSLFLADLAWFDAEKLLKHRLGRAIADQLLRAADNISSSVGEGYSRGTSRARCQFYEYALGSGREARDWYFKARHVLEQKVYAHRISICEAIIKSLLGMISRERRTNGRLTVAARIAPGDHATRNT